ncbi:MAG TPA: PaaI family thioesterase, partial [Myxococcales bacterium]
MGTEHFRRLEAMYATAPINGFFQPQLEVGAGKAELRIVVRPEFFHSAHAVHGSVYFKALDDAAFFAANSLVEDVFVLTASFNLHLLRPITSGTMIATGTVVHQSRSQILAESVLVDENGKQLARGS